MKDRSLTVGYIYARNKKIPALRLSGDWLSELGFGSGQKVQIKQLPGQLTIQLVEEANS
jgi:hypothetical protein